MGTTWSVQLYAEGRLDDPALRRLVQARLDEVIVQMSGWEPRSALCRFGQAPAGTWQPLPAAFATVVAEALRVATLSNGAFDPTLGALADLWGFGPSGPRAAPPTEPEMAAARATGGLSRFAFDPDRGAWQPGGLRLDLSGIAKGFAVDHVADALETAGVRSFLVEIGGELRGKGATGDGSPWWVGLEQPPGARFTPITAALHGLSVATSGDYRRGFEHDGARYAHTLDPRTGRPSAGPASVAVLHPSCMTADAWATALGVLAPEESIALAERQGLAAWLIARTADGFEERLTGPLQTLLDD